eukprot:1155970-Pelagomonas_calceolata.AAC.4
MQCAKSFKVSRSPKSTSMLHTWKSAIHCNQLGGFCKRKGRAQEPSCDSGTSAKARCMQASLLSVHRNVVRATVPLPGIHMQGQQAAACPELGASGRCAHVQGLQHAAFCAYSWAAK